jgi:hypothetical protein
MSNDWIESIKGDSPTDFEQFLHELFERAADAHDKARSEGRKGDEIYHQAEKDTLRRVFAFLNANLEVGSLIGSAPTNQIERERVNAYQRKTQELEDLQLAVFRISYILEDMQYFKRFDELEVKLGDKLTAAIEAIVKKVKNETI